MSREPKAVIGEDDYLIVLFTHDLEIARKVMREELLKGDDTATDDEDYLRERNAYIDGRLDRASARYVRRMPALPNSYAAAEGWSHSFEEYDQPGKGAMKAVVFHG